jgi:hypothetical protein
MPLIYKRSYFELKYHILPCFPTKSCCIFLLP